MLMFRNCLDSRVCCGCVVPERISSSPSIWTLDGTALLQFHLNTHSHTHTQTNNNNKPRTESEVMSDPRRYRRIRTRNFCWPTKIFYPSESLTWALINDTIDVLLMVNNCTCFHSSSKMVVSSPNERMRVCAPALWNYVSHNVMISGAGHSKRAFLFRSNYKSNIFPFHIVFFIDLFLIE